MPNVLVLGGTGYIGLSLAQALPRAGTYTVWGTARTKVKAKLLLTYEIIPIEEDVTDPIKLSAIIADNVIDIVVDTTSAYEQASQILRGTVNAAIARRDSLAKENMVGPKLGFVYCSGTWVHGSPSTRVSDLSPVGSWQSKISPDISVAWRPVHEQAVLASRDVLDVAILRPSEIYGRGSPDWGALWGSLLEAKTSGSTTPIQVSADATARVGTIHIDDVAAAFHAAIERLDGRLGSWPVFDLVTETLGVHEIMEAAKAALEVTALLEYVGTHKSYESSLALSLVSKLDSSRAKTVLGWEPRRREFLLNLAIYIRAWEANVQW